MGSNFMGLLSQLHHVETTFAAMLLEMALKFASLTETNIFVLVETANSRKFGGMF